MKLANNISCFILVSLASLVLSNSVLAADYAGNGSITILSPAANAILKSDMENKLDFNVKLGADGNHVHIYVDDQSPIVVRDVAHCPCSIVLPKLSSGKHTIVVKEAMTSHALTGLQGSVTVTVK